MNRISRALALLMALWMAGPALAVPQPTFPLVTARTIAQQLLTIYVGAITPTQPLAQQIFQRDTRSGGAFGLGTGTVVMTVAPTQPLTLLQYRMRDMASGAVLQDWATATPPLAAGSQTISFSVPSPGLKWVYLDIRANQDDTSVVLGTSPVGIGEIVAIAGQSLAEDMFSTGATGETTTIASLGLTPTPYGTIFAAYANNSGAYPQVADGADINYPPTAWVQPADGTNFKSTFAVEFLNRATAKFGVPVGMIGYAVGGTGIASWMPGTVHDTKFKAVVQAAGGRFGTLIWDQGHYETKNGNTAATYLAQLQTVIPNFASYSGTASVKRLVSTIPGIGNNYGSGAAAIEMVRATAKSYVGSDPQASYVDGLDATLYTDLVHPSQFGNITYADHFFRATAKALGAATLGDTGPVVTGASRANGSRWIYLTVSQTNGGTAWTSAGTPANQFQVFPAGTTASPVALDPMNPLDLSVPGQIGIQLAAAPTEPAAYDVWYRLPYDTASTVASAIYDNVTGDGLPNGRQLSLVATAIPVPAPVLNVSVATPSSTTTGTAVPVSGTYSNGTPTALWYSLDNGATYAAASNPSISGGNYSFSIPSAPVGEYKLVVKDPTTGGLGTSGLFNVAMASPPALPSIANAVFGIDAANPVGSLFTDTGNTAQAFSGATIGGVVDLAAMQNFNQPAAAARPTYATNVKNGMPGIRFTGTASQFLAATSTTLGETLRNSSGYTVACAYTPATLPSVASDILASGNRALGGSGTDQIRAGQVLASGTIRHGRSSDTTLYYAAISSAAAASQLIKSVSRYDGTNVKLAVNSLTEASTAAGAAATTSFDYAYLGAGYSGGITYFLDGWIHECRVWNTAATDAQRTSILSYFTSKWGS